MGHFVRLQIKRIKPLKGEGKRAKEFGLDLLLHLHLFIEFERAIIVTV